MNKTFFADEPVEDWPVFTTIKAKRYKLKVIDSCGVSRYSCEAYDSGEAFNKLLELYNQVQHNNVTFFQFKEVKA